MQEKGLMPVPQLEESLAAISKWEEEYHAFLKLSPALAQTYRNKWVAIHNGEVVDSGEERIPLALRAYSHVGYVPIYVGHVPPNPGRSVRIPSPRL
jgi:hypothetical protein